MSYEKYINIINKIVDNIKKYISEVNNILSLTSLIGQLNDNNVKINLLLEELNKEKSIIKKISKLDELENIIKKSLEIIKSEHIIKDVLVGRSFTFVADIKTLRDEIIEIEPQLMTMHDAAITELIDIIPLNTEEEKDEVYKNPKILVRLLDKMNDPKTVVIINKMIDDLMKLPNEPSEVANITMRTYKTEDLQETKCDNTIIINTGQNLKYNLQGLVSASWVAKNKLGESPNSGISELTIKRLTTIEKIDNNRQSERTQSQSQRIPIEAETDKINITAKNNKVGDQNCISYGDKTYKLDFMPNLLNRQYTYAAILAENIANNIVLNPPDLEIENKSVEESFKNDIMSRIRSNSSAALREWLRNVPKMKDIRELIRELMKVCAGAIKNSLIVSSKDVDKLLINMAVITNAYKRVESALLNNLRDRFGDIDINELTKKQDFNEIMQALISKSIEDINNQPSILDLLL